MCEHAIFLCPVPAHPLAAQHHPYAGNDEKHLKGHFPSRNQIKSLITLLEIGADFSILVSDDVITSREELESRLTSVEKAASRFKALFEAVTPSSAVKRGVGNKSQATKAAPVFFTDFGTCFAFCFLC